MNKVYTIFSELLKLVPRYRFDKAVDAHGAERYVKTFNAWSHFTAMLYSQITGKDSLPRHRNGTAGAVGPLV